MEAERRDRKQTRKLLPNVCIDQSDMTRTDDASQCSALYPSLPQLEKVDLDLDSYPAAPLPPPYVPPPQAQQPQAAAAQYAAVATAAVQPLPAQYAAAAAQPLPAQEVAPKQEPTAGDLSPDVRPKTLRTVPSAVNPLLTPPHTRTGQSNGTPRAETPTLYPPALMMPMVEVAGPQGPMLVFRSWTATDVMEAARHLPEPAASGTKFAEQFVFFCREFRPTMSELKRLLITKMKPLYWQKMAGKFPATDVRCGNIDWDHNENNDYKNAVQMLATEFTAAFPHKIDVSKINACCT